MNAVVPMLGMLGLALIAWWYARRAANAAHAAHLAAHLSRNDARDAVQVALVLARAVLDHEDVDKLAAGVMWAPRDGLVEALGAVEPGTLARALLDSTRKRDTAP